MKKGDRVYFTTVSILVAEGTVMGVEGPYIRVDTKAPGVTHVMASDAFATKEELRSSRQYSRAYWEKQQRMRMRSSVTNMASLWR